MWPTPQDYNEAIQNPRQCFRDAELQNASVVLNSLGLPKPVTGSFASVYQMDDSHGRQFAVRCFLHNIPDQSVRYGEISAELRRLALPYMVPFEFLSEGIYINNSAYPMLKMQWVNGRGLIEWLARRLDYPDQIAALANKFKEMCDALRLSGIAHGDLQHGNIIIADDELKLVDYDAMFVPSLAGRDCPEIGHRHYQHPDRTAKDYDADLDNFSAVSIHASLLCLSIDPTLWRSLGAGEECLLFRDEDYAAPLDSVAFRLLENHQSLDIQSTARNLRALCSRVDFAPASRSNYRRARQQETPFATDDSVNKEDHTSAQRRAGQHQVKPLPLGTSASGHNLREAAPVLVVTEPPKPRLRVTGESPTGSETPSGNALARSTVTPKKVPVQVLPRSAPSTKPPPPNWLIVAFAIGAFTIMPFMGYSIILDLSRVPPVKAPHPESPATALHNRALEELRHNNSEGLTDYTAYIEMIVSQQKENQPQRIAYNDLDAIASAHEQHYNYDFALAVRELQFKLVDRTRGVNPMTPRMTSETLTHILSSCAANRAMAGDRTGALILTAEVRRASNAPTSTPSWPERFRR